MIGELWADDSLELDKRDNSINAGVAQSPALREYLNVFLWQMDPWVLPPKTIMLLIKKV